MHLSIIVTNYNYGKFLGRCIRSLLNQNYDSNQYEIIVVDDCSSDDSREILNAFSQNVRLILLEKNLGLAGASNVGIRAAQGRYIVRVDADDYVHADFVRLISLGFDFFGKEVEAVAVDYFEVTPMGDVISYGDSRSNPIACGIGFKADALEHLGFYDDSLRLNEEVDLRERFLKEGFQFHHITLPLYRYVRHDGSLTRKTII